MLKMTGLDPTIYQVLTSDIVQAFTFSRECFEYPNNNAKKSSNNLNTGNIFLYPRGRGKKL